MARLECKCGCVMWNGEMPNDIEFSVFSDKTMNNILADDSILTLDLANKADYKRLVLSRMQKTVYIQRKRSFCKIYL